MDCIFSNENASCNEWLTLLSSRCNTIGRPYSITSGLKHVILSIWIGLRWTLVVPVMKTLPYPCTAKPSNQRNYMSLCGSKDGHFHGEHDSALQLSSDVPTTVCLIILRRETAHVPHIPRFRHVSRIITIPALYLPSPR